MIILNLLVKKLNSLGKCQKAEPRGRLRKTEVKAKWKIVTSHTARRSFGANLYK